MTTETLDEAFNPQTLVYDIDLLEIVFLCNGALAQDSPYDKVYYLEQIMNRAFAYLTRDQRNQVEEYLANKDYLPPMEIIIDTH
jgi:hypothetical protein